MLNFDWILASISTILTLDCIAYLERTLGRKCDEGDLKYGFCRFTAGDIESNLGMENRGGAIVVGEEQSDGEDRQDDTQRDRSRSREREMISENEAFERDGEQARNKTRRGRTHLPGIEHR